MELLACLQAATWFSLSMVTATIGVNVKQSYRPYLLVPVIYFALLAFWDVSDQKLGIEGTESVTMLIVIYISHITCVLCVEKYVLPKKNSSSYIDWIGGYNMLFNARWVGTHRQAPDVKRNPKAEIDLELASPVVIPEEFTSISTKTVAKILRTPRAVFLRNRAISLFTIWAILRLYSYLFAKTRVYGVELEMYDFLPTRESYFRRFNEITIRETIVRVWLVCYWVFYSVGLYTGFHNIFAIVFVASGLDKPEDWPPLFGNIRDATSVRNFWGKYWHRLVYRSYTSYGIWITKNVLRLPRDSLVGKMFINFFVFAISGCAHAIAVRQLGFSCGFWEELMFYCSSFVAVMLEGLVFTVFAKLTRGYKINSSISNTIGYVWVFTYLFITLPKSQYPKLWCAPQN
jgi:hypothetical protein